MDDRAAETAKDIKKEKPAVRYISVDLKRSHSVNGNKPVQILSKRQFKKKDKNIRHKKRIVQAETVSKESYHESESIFLCQNMFSVIGTTSL